jgi:protein-L-isoaspartate(D-aspartate) O-methyltransferase
MNSTTAATSPGALRARMVDDIRLAGHARSGRVEQVMRTVARHRFVPDASVEDGYADKAVITKSTSDGKALSCASVPRIVAMMLDQLDVQPGRRVLEIGAGTGYNAALLADLVGENGEVSTVDIDAEVTAQARENLDATGYERVRVFTRDGALGAAEHAPYERIIATVGSWDIPAAWWDQLAPGGRLVMPLRWRGQTRSVALVREGDRLRSDSVELCGFVPMLGQDGERTGHPDAGDLVTLLWDADQDVDLNALRGVLDAPKAEAWSGVTVGGNESFDGVWLRLTATEPGTCFISAEQEAVDTGLCTPAIRFRSPALVEHDSLAYFALRRQTVDGGSARFELGAIGHGLARQRLVDRISDQIRAWDADRGALPVITAYPAGTPDDQINTGHTIDKHDSRLVISF